MQPRNVARTEADINDLMEDLKYKLDTPIQRGIEKFINWYRKFYNILKTNIT